MPAVTFTKALDVIKLVAEGETTLAACEQMLISPVSFRALMKREPKLREMYDEAQEVLDDILADSLIDLSKMPSDPKTASVWSANVRFLLERRRPTKYGKVAENSNPDSEANKLLAQALNAAIDRIPQTAKAQAVLEATFTVVEPKKEAPQATPSLATKEETADDETGIARLRALGLI